MAHAFWSGSVAAFLNTPPAHIVATLAAAQLRAHRQNEAPQLRAWEDTVAVLHAALAPLAAAATWHLLLEYRLPRIGRCPDAVLLLPHAIVVLEVKAGATAFAAAEMRQVEDYALDLQDFHAGCRGRAILPVLLATRAQAPAATPALPLSHVHPVLRADPPALAALLRRLSAWPGTTPIDPAAWLAAPYQPVPTIVQAACLLYARHAVADIAAARAAPENLGRTTAAIDAAIAAARRDDAKVAIFVTGIPGAGKTLCGLKAVFAESGIAGATFLTGNPTLVHVLREALCRDAMARGMGRQAAQQRVESAVQALPLFRDHYVSRPAEPPAEAVLVIDEAQRCWSAAYAIRKSRDRAVRLNDSEPGLLLQALGRRAGFAAMVCLVGAGQEIHRGEGGIAEWARALAARPHWRAVAAEDGGIPTATGDPALHLSVPVRQVHHRQAAAWVAAVLDSDRAAAAAIAARMPLPFRLTRSLPALRAGLRDAARGARRAGLVASSAGKRLRAIGLGVEVAHMDAGAVARWFLDRWPDIRASDALETVATEFSIQGLELDYVGLCWDADLIRQHGEPGWISRALRGTRWQFCHGEAHENRLNTYRVLLTRARYDTIILVPQGAAGDPTRDPDTLDAIAAYLRACGVTELAPAAPKAAVPESVLL